MARPRKRTPGPTTHVVGYVRVSTAGQASSGAGLAAQRRAIESEAERRGWTVVAIHSDAGASGKTLRRRPGLEAAIASVERGEAGALVSAKLDRLSRSVVDFGGLLARASTAGWSLVVLDPAVDTSTPNGKMVAGIIAVLAEWEAEVIGQRTRDGLAEKRAAGVVLGRPRSIGATTRARIVSLRTSGLSWRAVTEELNRTGAPSGQKGGRWHPTSVRRVFLQERPEAA